MQDIADEKHRNANDERAGQRDANGIPAIGIGVAFCDDALAIDGFIGAMCGILDASRQYVDQRIQAHNDCVVLVEAQFQVFNAILVVFDLARNGGLALHGARWGHGGFLIKRRDIMIDYCQHCEHRVYVKRRGHVRVGGWVWFGVYMGFGFLSFAGCIFADFEVAPIYLAAQMQQEVRGLFYLSLFLVAVGLLGLLFRSHTYHCGNCGRRLDIDH